MNAVVAQLLQNPPVFFQDAAGSPAQWWLGRRGIELLAAEVRPGARTLETGAGVSTVAFAALGADHVSVAPAAEVVGRVRAYCDAHGVSLATTRIDAVS